MAAVLRPRPFQAGSKCRQPGLPPPDQDDAPGGLNETHLFTPPQSNAPVNPGSRDAALGATTSKPEACSLLFSRPPKNSLNQRRLTLHIAGQASAFNFIFRYLSIACKYGTRIA